MQALQPNIFIFRRVVFAFILYYLNSLAGVQLITHILVSLAYTCYVVFYKPFECPDQNRSQVFNEMSVALCSYVLIITFMLSINTDKQSVELKYNIGFFYIIFNSALLIKNIY